MKNIAKRAGWLFLALLFIVTGLGVGVWAFWQATHQPADTAATASQTPQAPKSLGTLSNYTPVTDVNKLKSIDLKSGTGKTATASSKVTVIYTGALATTGQIFDSSQAHGGQPATFSLDEVIKGWKEGIPGMKVGGERRLLIPASLAYGPSPPQGTIIPPNAPLVFDVTLLKIQ